MTDDPRVARLTDLILDFAFDSVPMMHTKAHDAAKIIIAALPEGAWDYELTRELGLELTKTAADNARLRTALKRWLPPDEVMAGEFMRRTRRDITLSQYDDDCALLNDHD